MYELRLVVMAFLCAMLLVAMVDSGTVNLTVGVTHVQQIESHWGHPANTYITYWNGTPCLVYVYPYWAGTRHVFIHNNVVIHVEERW